MDQYQLAVLNINFDESKDWEDIVVVLKDESYFQYTLAALSFAGAQHTLFSLNKLFLFDAISKMFSFLGKTPSLVRKCHISDLAILWSLFSWCVLTSLIFGENGKDTLSFMPYGQVTGFALSFIVHFVTRYKSVMGIPVVANVFADQKAIGNPSQANSGNICEYFFASADYNTCENFFAAIITFVSFLVVGFTYNPGIVQGFETLTNRDIDSENNYSGPASIGFSAFALLPTMVFYLQAIYAFPKSLKASYQSIVDDPALMGKCHLFALYSRDIFSAIVTALGYELIAESALDSYDLDNPIADSSRYILVTSISLMLSTYLLGQTKRSLQTTASDAMKTPLTQGLSQNSGGNESPAFNRRNSSINSPSNPNSNRRSYSNN